MFMSVGLICESGSNIICHCVFCLNLWGNYAKVSRFFRDCLYSLCLIF